MTFNNLHADSNCDCISQCSEDTSTLYAIKTSKAVIREIDFKSKYEKALAKGEPIETSSCEEECSFKGISCSQMTEETKPEVLIIYNQLFPSSPKYRPYMFVVRMKEKAGVFKCSPMDNNAHHYDFYKADTFTMDHIETLESISIADNV